MADTLDLRLVGPDTFEPALASEFHGRQPDFVLVLAEVSRYQAQPNAPRAEPFSLVFTGEPGLEQGTYQLEHHDLGRLDVFLVPIGSGPDGRMRYEAAFN
jgi:hypothetical protein